MVVNVAPEPTVESALRQVLQYENVSFGESGEGPGQYKLPRFIAVTPKGSLVISDFVNQRVQLVSDAGRHQHTIGTHGTAPGHINGPSGVACDSNHIFLCEGGNHRVQKLSIADGTPVGRAGKHGRDAGNLWCPMGVAVAMRAHGDGAESASNKIGEASLIFVADHVNGRVACFEADKMEHVRTFSERGSEPGQLLYPTGIAVKDDEVFVADTGNHRISVFSKKGEFQRVLGETPGGGPGSGPGQLTEPRGLTFAMGWLVVAESKRLSVFSPPGIFQQCVELPHVGQLWGCGFDSMSEVCYVTDIRAGSPKIFTLAMRGGSFDDNLSEAEKASKKTALKKAAEAEKSAKK